MNSKENMSPEEKLLHLIRSPVHKKTAKQQLPSEASGRDQGPKAPAAPSAKPKKHEKRNQKAFFSGAVSINCGLINRCILFFIFVTFCFFGLDFYFNTAQTHLFFDGPGVKGQKPVKERTIKPFSYFQQAIDKRVLFQSFAPEKEAARVVPAGATFRDLVKNLTLMGIVSGRNQQAVIEDAKTKKTYFLYEGDFLGEIKVEQIYADRVVLEYRGENVQLFI